ncbi:armadillo repeat protein [Diaporthe amygdali]|uniref:armadillo repeat protein n=1 Tax=Phomopsis amygdali TaxID=1214568 RepID=UPI0022FE0D70|nr:armadillo repeat protein [Diaporthe amygdali]KAJ0125097.1 armadillo repeat protein [Diaporthe amygdali]
MARVPITALLSHDQDEQLSALRTLKNEIVGHDQKKEKWIENGVIEPVVKVLDSSRSSPSTNGKDSRSRIPPSRSLTGEESVRLQALQILASLANGGFAFLAPILAAGALSAILSNIPPADNPPQVVVAALRAAVNIAEASTLAPPTSVPDIANLADVVFVPALLDAFRDILTNSATNHTGQTQINLVARLISLLCREERTRVDLTNQGILEALATNLAAVVVARGYVVPGAENVAQSEGVLDLIPEPAASCTDVTAILEASSAIIGDSRWRASVLVYAPSLVAVFPHPGSPRRSKGMKACVNSFELAGLSNIASKDLGALDCFLPVVPEYQVKGTAISSFPPLGSPPPRDYLASSKAPSIKWIASSLNWDTAQADTAGPNTEAIVEETESPLIPWLIHTVRSAQGMERIMAASVLTSLHRTGLANKSREAYMGHLIVPILLQTLEDIGITCGAAAEATFVDTKTVTNWSIVERTLAILARLIVDSEFLQKCAFDCDGVKIVSVYLKSAYEPLASKSSKAWSPNNRRENTGEREIGLPTSRLGTGGQLPLQVHRARVRESALKAVAGLAASKDDYRKALVEQDLVPFIVESLSPNPSNPKNKERPKSPKRAPLDDGGFDAAYGVNPITVIVAACHALRMLARSVSILRTTLEDNAVATPAFRLLRHPDVDIQIAASALMCNLVTDVAPMREHLNDVGVMRILCEQTRSQNPALRLNALWALKNWINGVSMEAKKECVEELSAGWLVRLICDDTEDDALYERTTKSKKQAANDMDDDVEMAQAGEESGTSSSAMLNTSTSPVGDEQGRTPRLRQTERKIAALRESELSLMRKVRDDDLAVQEQGLNFVRNLIGPATSATDSARDHADMIDYLFNILGQDRFFELLHSKLQLKVLHPFDRRYSTSRESRVLYPQARIVSAVVYILVHMAASVPRHRQVLISQTKLLTDLGKQFHSKDKDVRVALCHLMTNLTWRDDPDDEDSSRQRAGELKKLGLLTKLETLESDDGELDVRERAKAAIWQISQPRGF